MSLPSHMNKINYHLFSKHFWSVLFFTALFLLVGCDENYGAKKKEETQEKKNTEAVGKVSRLSNLPTREPKGAGLFYPEDKQKLYTLVEELLAKGEPLHLPGTRAVQVPHAGYVYSGEVAAAAMRELSKGFKRVFILAANHSGEANFSGVSLPEVGNYSIPGAEIPLSQVVEDLRKQPLFTNVPEAHTKYMIEVELPFLYSLAEKEGASFAIIPMIVGRLDREAIVQLAETLNRYVDDETVFVFSVDLSHFYTDREARKLDFATIDAVLSRNQAALARSTTDGNQVLMTMVELAELNGWDATLLKYKNSGDATGDRNRVVGYAGIAFHEPVRFSQEQRKILLKLARQSIENYLENKATAESDLENIRAHSILTIPRGVFVTLKKNGKLRGCIGDLISNDPLYKGVMSYAIKSAVQDKRFPPVTREELDELDLSISVLEYPRRVKVEKPEDYLEILKQGQDGVILIHKGRNSTYLPQVWDTLPDPILFLSNLCIKQGSPQNCWKDTNTVLFKYSAYEFGEE